MRVYIDPTVILVSTKVDETIIETFENLTEDRLALPFVLEVRPPGEFSSDTGKSKLASLSFENFDESHMSLVIPGDLNLLEDEDMENAPGQRGRLLRLAGLIDLESRITVLILNPDFLMEHGRSLIPDWLRWCFAVLSTTEAHCLPSSRGSSCRIDVPRFVTRNVHTQEHDVRILDGSSINSLI